MRISRGLILAFAFFLSVRVDAQVVCGRNIATDIAVDGSGNVYVTGSVAECGNCSSQDWATIKYDASGHQVWLVRYDGPAHWDDRPYDIAVDASGNVYVSGYSRKGTYDFDATVVKYDPEGEQIWTAVYDGPAHSDDQAHDLAVDTAGNVYIAGQSQGQLIAIKYDPEGNRQWLARYVGLSSSSGSSVAVDAGGKVYVAGRKNGILERENLLVVKYDGAGNTQWEKEYNGPVDGDDVASAVAVDGAGNVYVGGFSAGDVDTSLYVYVTIKYGPAGDVAWVAREDRPAPFNDILSDLALDASGNVYVTGWYQGADSWDCGTIKYDTSGVRQWLALYDGPEALSSEWALDIDVDASGNAYIAGYGGPGTALDYITAKYLPDGTLDWTARYDSPGGSTDLAQAVAVDGSGNVCVTGMSHSSGPGGKYVTIKYDAAGSEQWVANHLGCSPDALLDGLIQRVQEMSCRGSAGLSAILKAAMTTYQSSKARDYIGTINQLEAFKTKCEKNPELTDADRNLLLSHADMIIAYLLAIVGDGGNGPAPEARFPSSGPLSP